MAKKELTVKQRKFLMGYAASGTLVAAHRISGVDCDNHARWIRGGEAYQEAFRAAKEAHLERVVEEIHRRGVEGYDDYVVYQGELQYEPERDDAGNVKRDKRGRPVFSSRPLAMRRYSDNLLMFYAKSLAPERFRDNAQVAVTGAGGAPLSIDIRFVNPSPPSDAG